MLTKEKALLGYQLTRMNEPRHPANKWLVAYWQARRGADGIASRADMPFSDLRHLLPAFFVIEPVDDGRDFIYRLAGTEIEERLNLRLTGRRFTECYAEEAEAAIRFYGEILQCAAVRVLSGKFLGRDIEYANFEAVQMPVRNEAGRLQICGSMFDMDRTGSLY